MKATSATCASETHRPACSSNTARGYLIGVQASSSMRGDRGPDLGFIRAVTENHAFAATAAAMTSRR